MRELNEIILQKDRTEEFEEQNEVFVDFNHEYRIHAIENSSDSIPLQGRVMEKTEKSVTYPGDENEYIYDVGEWMYSSKDTTVKIYVNMDIADDKKDADTILKNRKSIDSEYRSEEELKKVNKIEIVCQEGNYFYASEIKDEL